jgi:serine/threonine protein kinase
MEISYDELLQMNQTTYNNRYKEIRSLGNGSFGKLILAKDLKSNKEVAIKIIDKTNFDHRLYKLFDGEIKILKTINHPNIVKFYDFYETDKNIYIIMQYIKGGTLKEYLNKYKIISENKVKEIIFYLLNAVEYLHKNEIVHRDIKLENIMLENENDLKSLKLIDFGLSISINDTDNNEYTNTHLCGTFLYMPPELLTNKEIHKYNSIKERDIWAIGITMYRLLYNKHPFHNKEETFTKLKENLKNYTNTKNIVFHDEINKVNRNGKKLISQLLEPDWTKRINANFALKKSYFERFNKSNYLFDMNFMRSSIQEDNKIIKKKGKELLMAMIFLKNYKNNIKQLKKTYSTYLNNKSNNTSFTTNDNSSIFINVNKNKKCSGFFNESRFRTKNKIKYILNSERNLLNDNNNHKILLKIKKNNYNINNIDINVFNKKSTKNLLKLKVKLDTAKNPTKIINNNNINNKINNNSNNNNHENISFNNKNDVYSQNNSLNNNKYSITSNNFYKINRDNSLSINSINNLEKKTKLLKNNTKKNLISYNNVNTDIKKYYKLNKTESKIFDSKVRISKTKKNENFYFPLITQK